MLPLFILTPLAVLVLVNLPIGAFMRKWAWPLTLAMAAAQALVVVFVRGDWLGAPGYLDAFFRFGLALDDLSLMMLLAIAVVVIATLFVARATMKGSMRLANYSSVMLIALVGMNGMALLRGFFVMWIFIEVVSIASFILIAFERDRGGLEGAFNYIILSTVATVLMVSAVGLFILCADDTTFVAIHKALESGGRDVVLRVAVGLFICGALLKGGLVPFHGWLPGAYAAAPASVSVFLAGIATKATGVYALVRLTREALPESALLNETLLFIGALSIIVGALGALYQSNLKRLFAYSSVSQVGYIVLALGCGTPLGYAAAVEQRTGTTDMDRLGGLGGRMPATNVTSIIGTLSTAGVPPLSGFWSKLVILIALWQSGHPVYAGVAVMMSVATLAYLLMMQRKVFFGNTPDEMAAVREASPGIVFAAVMLAAITVGMGVLFPLVLNTFVLPLVQLF